MASIQMIDDADLETSVDKVALDPNARIVSTMRNYPGMKTIIAEYIESLPEEVRKMRHFLECGQMEPLRRVAHQLHGTGGGYGFDLMSELAADVEAAINAHSQPAAIGAKTNTLIEMIRRVDGFEDRQTVLPANGGPL